MLQALCIIISQWLANDFLMYLKEWEDVTESAPGRAREKRRACLSRETLQGLRITGKVYNKLLYPNTVTNNNYYMHINI